MAAPAAGESFRDRLRSTLSPDVKAKLAGLLCRPAVGSLIGILCRDRISSGPLTIRTDCPSISPRTKAQIFWGIYESAEIRMIRRYLRPELDVMEIGASIGVVSSHAADRLSPGSRMVCVEANPDLIPAIRANLDANHPDRSVQVLNYAVDYENAPGTTRMRLTEDTAGSRLGRLEVGIDASVREVEVRASTLARLVSEAGLRDYALISDVEGAEAGFIFGDASELDGCRQMIIELHDTCYRGRSLRWQDLLAALRDDRGFRVVECYGPVQVLER